MAKKEELVKEIKEVYAEFRGLAHLDKKDTVALELTKLYLRIKHINIKF